MNRWWICLSFCVTSENTNIELNFIIDFILFLHPMKSQREETQDRTWIMRLRYFILYVRDEGYMRVLHGLPLQCLVLLGYSFLRKWRRSILAREKHLQTREDALLYLWYRSNLRTLSPTTLMRLLSCTRNFQSIAFAPMSLAFISFKQIIHFCFYFISR